MKKILYLISAVLFSTTLFAQATSTEPENKVDISFARLEYDYGVMEQGGNGLCEFDFTNSGTEPLNLINVQASCGCTAPEWSKEPIKPGERGKISVKYNTNIVGTFHKTVKVYSNAKTSPVILTIKGEIKPKSPVEVKQ